MTPAQDRTAQLARTLFLPYVCEEPPLRFLLKLCRANEDAEPEEAWRASMEQLVEGLLGQSLPSAGIVHLAPCAWPSPAEAEHFLPLEELPAYLAYRRAENP